MNRLRTLMHSRALMVVGIVVALAVPAYTLPKLPDVSVVPVLLGLLPWVVGKYLLCPLRWRVLTDAGFSRWWHIRAYAESELLGLFTPGHVGADLWRLRRLTTGGLGRADAVASVALDRFVGAIGLTLFVVFAGTALPVRMIVIALAVATLVLVALLALRALRPDLMPKRPMPSPRQLAHGLLLSAGYQATTAALLLGSLAATGHTLAPLEVMAAFGASQIAGALPGPQGASPRDGALVVGLVAFGVPWVAAAAAVALKAAVAWLPALLLGGTSLLLTRKELRRRMQPEPAPA